MYWYIVDDLASCGGVRPLHGSGEMAVSGKGTIRFELGPTDECFRDGFATRQPYLVTGGSDTFGGATGAGTVSHDLAFNGAEPTGTDTWSGSLEVPGLEFDVTPPRLSGLADKTVRVRRGVKRVRVKFRVTAHDAVDGALRPNCQPGSGSRFKIGRTLVRCSAMDSSANSSAGRFRIVVKRRR